MTMEPDYLVTCREYYQALHASTNDVLEASLEGERLALQGNSHSHLADLEIWLEVTEDKLENQLLKVAALEYQFSLLALVHGLYRQAFMSLRSFLEIALGAVFLSGSELQLRLRLSEFRDLRWSLVVDDKLGLFSNDFFLAFCPELIDEAPQYKELTKTLYRECSGFVHGDPRYQPDIPEILEFSEDLFNTWHSQADSANLIVCFVFASRYMRSLNSENIARLEPVLIDVLGHIEAVREFLNG